MDNKPAMDGKKKGKGMKAILIIVGVVIVGIIIMAALTFFAGYKALSAPANDAQEWLTLIRDGNVDAAYEESSNEFKSVASPETMTEFLAQYPVLAENTSASFSQFSIDNNVAVVSGTIEGAGETSPITITMVKQDGKWRVVEVSLNAEDVPDSSSDF